ncbi:hypothetical protein LSH36_271g07065 [Paralvinella palmiformis]|uniref:Uncharacterized protein n=1 Tax=Paralvinella palmiformis TaxID=53620 RepID=A0AAD9N2I6_9ANNE|nr:hypothetical protein LSH36_271g07065 [Paralvinella palmiformis]
MANVSAKTRLKILSIVAVCSSFFACISLIIALATDHWQDIQVNRAGLLKIVQYKPELQQSLSTNVLYFDRHRGLFYYCRAVLRRTRIIPEICVRDIAFDKTPVLNLSHVESPSELQSLMSDLRIRNILVITITVLMTMADVGVLFAAIIGLVAISVNRRTIYTAAMTFVFLATVFAGSSMAIFHGLDFLERTKLNVYMFPAATQEERFYSELITHTKITLGYSYCTAWLGGLFSCVSAILYLSVRKTQANPRLAGKVGGKSSNSMLQLTENPTENRQKMNMANRLPSLLIHNNAYAMMESNYNKTADVSEKGSHRTPSTDDWNPDHELPPDDPIHYQ